MFSPFGELLLASSYRLRPENIRRLHLLGFKAAWVMQEDTETIIPPQVLEDQVILQTNQALRATAEVVQAVARTRCRTRESMRTLLLDQGRFRNVLAAVDLEKSAAAIVESLRRSREVMINASTIRCYDENLFEHHLQTTVIALVLGKKLGLGRPELQALAVGCLLHDLGRILIPWELTHQPSNRLAWEEYLLLQEHTSLGFVILRENPALPLAAAHVAFQHHERPDGGGYPRGLRGRNEIHRKNYLNEKGNIHRFAEIAAVANTFDTLVNPGDGTPAKSPSDAIKAIILAAGTQLNRALVNLFMSITPVFPVGSTVTVMAESREFVGCKGGVVRQNESHLQQPEIMLLFNSQGKRMKPIPLNLVERTDIHIQFTMLRN
jgi:HD-GYP domain-containing protein (c-di-GMP phosphodiesterase class II)